MHEHSLLKDIMFKISSISRENGNAHLSKATIRLGAMSHISADHFRHHFDHAARGTAAADAELEIIESEDMNDPHAQDIILESVELIE